MAPRDGLAARRKALGLTQESLAEALRVERSTVARWEQGTSTPRPWLRRRLAQVLDLTPDELTPVVDGRAPTAAPSPGAEPPEPWPLDAGPNAGQATRPVDAGYIESIRNDTRRLIDLDTSYGGNDVARLAVGAFRSAYRRLASGVYVASLEHDLRAAVGELAQVAAWAAYDADQQPLARRLTNEALLQSRLAGDRRMELFELAQLAMQDVHLGQANEALRIADEVIDQNPASTRVAAVFRVRKARALAQRGERARALTEHSRSESALTDEGSGSDPDWTWWVDPSELAWHRAMSLASLDDWPAAVDLFQQAWELRPATATRARYNDAAHVLDTQATVGAWHDAETTMAHLLASSNDVSSARTTTLLRRTLRQLARHRHALPSTLGDSTQQLRQALDVT